MLGISIKNLFGMRKSVIEPATGDDYAAISEIHQQCFHRGWSDGEIEKLLSQNNCFCLVARKPGQANKPPSGFIIVRQVLDEAEIITIASKPSARRRGVAQRLVDAAIRKLSADRVSRLFLEVDEKNRAAIQLYRNSGFSQVGTRDGYYSNTADNNKPSSALVMQLELG